MDTTDDEEKYPINTDKPSHIYVSPIKTDKPAPIAAVPAVATISPVDIVTRAPIEKVKTKFHPVTNTVFPSAKLPASLS